MGWDRKEEKDRGRQKVGLGEKTERKRGRKKMVKRGGDRKRTGTKSVKRGGGRRRSITTEITNAIPRPNLCLCEMLQHMIKPEKTSPD